MINPQVLIVIGILLIAVGAFATMWWWAALLVVVGVTSLVYAIAVGS